jgi:hypothetical protein
MPCYFWQFSEKVEHNTVVKQTGLYLNDKFFNNSAMGSLTQTVTLKANTESYKLAQAILL